MPQARTLAAMPPTNLRYALIQPTRTALQWAGGSLIRPITTFVSLVWPTPLTADSTGLFLVTLSRARSAATRCWHRTRRVFFIIWEFPTRTRSPRTFSDQLMEAQRGNGSEARLEGTRNGWPLTPPPAPGVATFIKSGV